MNNEIVDDIIDEIITKMFNGDTMDLDTISSTAANANGYSIVSNADTSSENEPQLDDQSITGEIDSKDERVEQGEEKITGESKDEREEPITGDNENNDEVGERGVEPIPVWEPIPEYSKEEAVELGEDIDSRCDEEMEVFQEYEALEADCQAEEQIAGLDISAQVGNGTEMDNPAGDRYNDTILERPGDAKRETVEKTLGANTPAESATSTSSSAAVAAVRDPLYAKGYATDISKNVRRFVNLPLKAERSTFTEHEIFCEAFPPKMMENELIPLFEQFGRVYKMRIFTERGFIFVSYTNAIDADRAIRSLNYRCIQGRRVRAFRSSLNRRIIVQNIPRSAMRHELMTKFGSVTRHLESVKVYNHQYNENKNRGFCYLEYEDNASAKRAMQILSTTQLFNHPTVVDWPNRHLEWLETPDTMYISNLRATVGVRDLRNLFSPYGKLLDVVKFGNFAKVKFQRAEDARRGALGVNKLLLGNENVDITFTQLIKPSEPQNDWTDMLYIKNLAPTLTTQDLRKMFSAYGMVMEADRNDGFASIRFRHWAEAKLAARSIDKKRLGNNAEISSSKFSENCRIARAAPQSVDTLYISNLRSGLTTSDLRQYFSPYGQVKEIDKDNQSASVRFYDPEKAKLAAQAHAAAATDKHWLGDNVRISITKHVEKPPEKKRIEVSDTLYIYNTYADISIWQLRKCFSAFGALDIEIHNGFATVRFRNENAAQLAARQVDKICLGNANPQILFFPRKR